MDPVNPDAATLDSSTMCTAYFFADGTKQILQRTIYSTIGYKKTGEAAFEDKTTYADKILPNTWSPPPPVVVYTCFNPEAKVLMENKSWKPIAEVNVGDKVIGANGDINTVTKTRTINVGNRKMVKFKEGFYATDDHLFMTDKGWKTWNPSNIVDNNMANAPCLEGENREKGIDSLDKLKILDNHDDINLEQNLLILILITPSTI